MRNINPKTLKLYKSTNLRDEKRGLPLESDSLQLSSKLQSLKWSEMVRNGKFVKVGSSNGVPREREKEWRCLVMFLSDQATKPPYYYKALAHTWPLDQKHNAKTKL
ncbi:hypothetical protein QL285_052289 [Trifolium repens]|nr:hypothetical protein QL285_052287 [Trifolium repens]KAK2402801.1 hypothetical protein QL285_052289 [Trifolium repens]